MKDLTESASVQVASGLKVTQTEQWLAPAYFRQDDVLPFGKVATYSDGKTGWEVTPQASGPLPPAEAQQIGLESFRMWFPLMLSDRDPDRIVTAEGNAKIRISDKSGHSVLLALDPATGLPASEAYGNEEEIYADWRETNGVKLPWKITVSQGGQTAAGVTVTDIKLNQGLTPEQLSKKP